MGVLRQPFAYLGGCKKGLKGGLEGRTWVERGFEPGFNSS